MPRQLKKAERQEIKVVLRQTGLDGRRAKSHRYRPVAKPAPATPEAGGRFRSGSARSNSPDRRSRSGSTSCRSRPANFEFLADVDHLEGQVVDQGNHAQREATVIDDFLRLMYVEYEPTWEWRFIKEVFHRDPLVGMHGFRTFLRSSDPEGAAQRIRCFLPSLTPKRSEFLANDVIFLGDMPSTALSERFCEMTKEFVTQFGGGLVIIAGPRFGPGQLGRTRRWPTFCRWSSIRRPDMRDDRPFHMQLTLDSLNYKFMQLGEGDQAATPAATPGTTWACSPGISR